MNSALLAAGAQFNGPAAQVAAPGGGPGITWAMNKPSGLTLLRDSNLQNPTGEGWTINYPDWQIGIDADAPYGPACMQIDFAEGSTGDGGGGAQIYENLPGWRRLYYCMWVKFKSNYRLHYNGEKFHYPLLARDGGGFDSSLMQLHNNNNSEGTTVAWVYTRGQQGSTDWPFGFFQTEPVFITKGEWTMVEIEHVTNSISSVYDGVFRLWLNGVLASEDTACKSYETDTVQTLDILRIDATRGGGTDNGPVPAGGQWRRYSRLAVYGATT